MGMCPTHPLHKQRAKEVLLLRFVQFRIHNQGSCDSAKIKRRGGLQTKIRCMFYLTEKVKNMFC